LPIACGGLPALAADGSIRVVCSNRAYAFAPDGRPMAGWPVEFPAGLFADARVVGLDLYALNYYSVENEDAIRLVAAAADGKLEIGAPWDMPSASEERVQLGPDGTGYVLAYVYEAGHTEITAYDLGGTREGWPVRVSGQPDRLAFGRDGRIYATEGEEDRTPSRFVVFGPDGRSLPIGSDRLPVALTSDHTGAGPNGPPPPVVAEDGTTWLVTEDRGTTVYRLDPTGQAMAGWPYRDTSGLQWSYCPPDTGGSCWRPNPAAGPGNVLYLLHPPESGNLGGSIVAIGPNGRVRPGWPVVLQRPGAHFRSVVVGSDGTVYALAVEPEGGDRSSASILAIGPDSTVRWITTIVEP
jgi:hypothetical protein